MITFGTKLTIRILGLGDIVGIKVGPREGWKNFAKLIMWLLR